MNKPSAKGWCPSTLIPMKSGDGLLIRIKPPFSRLTSRQAQTIAMLSERYGNGFLDITNRANLQIRGLSQNTYPLMLKGLQDIGIAEKNEVPDRINLVLCPFIPYQSIGWRCAKMLYDSAGDFPNLPVKFGFAIDCGRKRYLSDISADIRIEKDNSNKLLIRFDGCEKGYVSSEKTFISDILEALNWFSSSQKKELPYKRMHQLLMNIDVPDIYAKTKPQENKKSLNPGFEEDRQVISIPFGQLKANQLLQLADGSQEIIFSVNRCLIIDKIPKLSGEFIKTKNDLRYNVTACTGMPGCASASINTKRLALKLSESELIQFDKSYHLSGCKKGCALQTKSDICIVGENGSYNLLENGFAWDEPKHASLSEVALFNKLV